MSEKEKKEIFSFLYMLPVSANVRKLADALDFVDESRVEIWTEVNLMELALQGGVMTFEDLMPDIRGAEDERLLGELAVKQLYACDYEARDSAEVKRIMETLTEKLGGFIASDTEDFRPFLQIGELP